MVSSFASFFHVSFLLRLQFGFKAKEVVVVVTEDGNTDGSSFRFFLRIRIFHGLWWLRKFLVRDFAFIFESFF